VVHKTPTYSVIYEGLQFMRFLGGASYCLPPRFSSPPPLQMNPQTGAYLEQIFESKCAMTSIANS
jgi:hypothetical protein